MALQPSQENVRRQLSRWVKSGKIVALRRGVYVLADGSMQLRPHPFVLANEMRRASYVTMQSALAHYGMIPEFVPAVTSVTTARPEDLNTPVGRFMFRHVKKELLWGMKQVELLPGQWARLATPEKALIDLIYLTPGSDNENYLRELRLETVEFFRVDVLREFGRRSESHKVMRAIDILARLWESEEKERGL
jgi:predicted transcriptional regulator of viral defense system